MHDVWMCVYIHVHVCTIGVGLVQLCVFNDTTMVEISSKYSSSVYKQTMLFFSLAMCVWRLCSTCRNYCVHVVCYECVVGSCYAQCSGLNYCVHVVCYECVVGGCYAQCSGLNYCVHVVCHECVVGSCYAQCSGLNYCVHVVCYECVVGSCYAQCSGLNCTETVL